MIEVPLSFSRCSRHWLFRHFRAASKYRFSTLFLRPRVYFSSFSWCGVLFFSMMRKTFSSIAIWCRWWFRSSMPIDYRFSPMIIDYFFVFRWLSFLSAKDALHLLHFFLRHFLRLLHDALRADDFFFLLLLSIFSLYISSIIFCWALDFQIFLLIRRCTDAIFIDFSM